MFASASEGFSKANLNATIDESLARFAPVMEAARADAASILNPLSADAEILRRLDADSRQLRQGVAELYRRYSVVGFETYGEQFRAMHLNQTFTGIAIGRAPES